MFSNWKPKVAAIVGFITFVITVLGFFGVNAKELREFMTTHYLWLIGALVSFALFVWGSYTWWRSSRVTAENAQAKIRQWLDQFNIEHGVVRLPFDDWVWGLRAQLRNGPTLFIARRSSRPDSILFRGQIRAQNPELRAIYDTLSEPEKDKLFYKLRLDASRAKFFFNQDEILDWVTFDHWFSVRSLTHSTFIDDVNQIYFSADIIWNTISLELGGKPPPTLPSSTPDKEASPPSPAS